MQPLERLGLLWVRLSQGFWFLPGLIVVLLAAAALGAIELDRGFGEETGIPRTFDGDAQASRSILSSIAAGFITVVGVAFSITIVTLQLVSSQFSPLTLSTFLADRLNQVTVGVFVGIVVYCLLTLRVIRSGEESSGSDVFVPGLAVTLAIAFALLGLALLIAFIHHLSSSIQVTAITERVATDVLEAVETLYPEQFGKPVEDAADEALARWGAEAPPGFVHPGRPGYVESVDVEALAEALPAGARIHVRVRPGEFVTPAGVLAAVWPAELADDERSRRVRRTVTVASSRTMRHDVGFGLRQLADIALRALSPSLNDPTSAVTCVGYLQAAYEALVVRAYPGRLRRLGDDGDRELVVEGPSFTEQLSYLEEVARHGRGDHRVLAAVREALDSIEAVANEARADERAAAAADLRERVREWEGAPVGAS